MNGRILRAVVLSTIGMLATACGPRAARKGGGAPPAVDDGGAAGFEKTPGAAEQGEASLRGKSFAPAAELAAARFDYDRTELSDEARRVLKRNASWLRERPEVEIQIEGHCDERGTTEYNIALGQRRAVMVRDYYKLLGIKMSRMSTISYGEEKPACSDSNEECWRRNRRVETLVRAK